MKEELKQDTGKKKKYTKPEIKTEKLNAYGALCNGTSNGGRKASTGAVPSCRANRLNS